MKSLKIILVLFAGVLIGGWAVFTYLTLNTSQSLSSANKKLIEKYPDFDFSLCELQGEFADPCFAGVISQQALRSESKKLCAELKDEITQRSCESRIDRLKLLTEQQDIFCREADEGGVCKDLAFLFAGIETQDSQYCDDILTENLRNVCSLMMPLPNIEGLPIDAGLVFIDSQFTIEGLSCDAAVGRCQEAKEVWNQAVRNNDVVLCEQFASLSDACNNEVRFYQLFLNGTIEGCNDFEIVDSCQLDYVIAKALESRNSDDCSQALTEDHLNACQQVFGTLNDTRFGYLTR